MADMTFVMRSLGDFYTTNTTSTLPPQYTYEKVVSDAAQQTTRAVPSAVRRRAHAGPCCCYSNTIMLCCAQGLSYSGKCIAVADLICEFSKAQPVHAIALQRHAHYLDAAVLYTGRECLEIMELLDSNRE